MLTCCLATKSCPALCDPMDCIPPGSSVHGILQARILVWVAIPFPRGSSQLKDLRQVSFTGRQIIYHCATRKPHVDYICIYCIYIYICFHSNRYPNICISVSIYLSKLSYLSYASGEP